MTGGRRFNDDVTDSGFFGSEGGDGAEALDPAVVELVDELMERAPAGREGLVRVLRGLQLAFDRVSWRVQELVADRFGLSPAQIAGVVGTCPALSAERQGRLKIDVCTGSGCCLRGGDEIYLDARRAAVEGSSAPREPWLAVRQERCLGLCGWAPAIRLNDRLVVPAPDLKPTEVIETVLALTDGEVPG